MFRSKISIKFSMLYLVRYWDAFSTRFIRFSNYKQYFEKVNRQNTKMRTHNQAATKIHILTENRKRDIFCYSWLNSIFFSETIKRGVYFHPQSTTSSRMTRAFDTHNKQIRTDAITKLVHAWISHFFYQNQPQPHKNSGRTWPQWFTSVWVELLKTDLHCKILNRVQHILKP